MGLSLSVTGFLPIRNPKKMTNETERSTPKDLTKPIEAVYKDAVDNLRFIKQQEWTVTRYALTAYAALFAVAKIAPNASDKIFLIAATCLVALFSLMILCSLLDSLEKFRSRIGWVYKNYFSCDEREGLRLSEPKGIFNTYGFIVGLMIVSLLGAAITSLAIWKI
jgi:hypothetical protein